MSYPHVGFVVVCATVLVVLLNAPDIKTPRTPDNKTHENPKIFAGCTSCHLPGGDGPEVIPDHLSGQNKLRADHVKCYLCHKPVEK